jgi:CBS-domain-containing membrane protein
MTAFIAISIITSWSSYFGEGRDFRFAFAYNGASAALIYCMPNSPAGTPKNMFVGHTIAGITTVTITYCIFGAGGWTWLAASLSVSFSILFMQLCGCVNPPAAAASLVYALSTQDGDVQEYAFLYVGCVIVGATIMVIIGVIFDNIPKNQRYPVSWI